MTNFEYIMENMTVRDFAKAMDPVASGFALAGLAGIVMPIEWSWALSGFVWLVLTLINGGIRISAKS